MAPASERPKRYSLIRFSFITAVIGVCFLLYFYSSGVQSRRAIEYRPIHGDCSSVIARSPKRIAIIGAGAGGASTAYYLSRFGYPCQSMTITVYERSSYIGGRSTTVNVYGDATEPVELGASIFVQVNRILVSAAKEFGLLTTNGNDDRPRESPDTLGVWDGEIFRFVRDEGASMWWSIAKLIWKYGLAPVRTQRLKNRVVAKFTQMYDEPYFPFRSLSQTAQDLGLIAVTSTMGNAFLKANAVTPPFSTDIIQASTRVNYAQNLGEIHGLETMVCMSTDGAMAIKGGNWQIFDNMLRAASANVLLNTSVSEVSKQADGTYLVSFKAQTGSQVGKDSMIEEFDSVVIAAPLQFTNIKISPSTIRIPDRISYVNLHVTLFASPHKISPTVFNLPMDSSVPEIILTTLPNSADSSNDTAPSGFFSISTLRTVKNRSYHPPRIEYLYKIFSPQPVNATFISALLGLSPSVALDAISKDNVSWLYQHSWNSYPYLLPRVTFDDLQLDVDLWYTSGIESFISTMETSSLMGMNVAKLMVDDWTEAWESRSEAHQGL